MLVAACSPRTWGDPMLTKYIEAAMKRAKFEKIEEGTYFGSIPGLKGLWADGDTRESCEDELRSVLEGWIIVMLRRNEAVPPMGRVTLGPPLSKTA